MIEALIYAIFEQLATNLEMSKNNTDCLLLHQKIFKFSEKCVQIYYY